jgi:hypothetical protein
LALQRRRVQTEEQANCKTTEFRCVKVEAQCESSGNMLVNGKIFKLDKQLDCRTARVNRL